MQVGEVLDSLKTSLQSPAQMMQDTAAAIKAGLQAQGQMLQKLVQVCRRRRPVGASPRSVSAPRPARAAARPANVCLRACGGATQVGKHRSKTSDGAGASGAEEA
jgi:hypothetical protein